MSTYPPRRQALRETLTSILPQLDELCLYLNQYSEKNLVELIQWVEDRKANCHVNFVNGKNEAGNIQDMGKFWGMQKAEGYVFLLDDDLKYPADYTRRHIKAIELHRTITTIHGRIITHHPMTRYFGHTKSFHYRQEMTRPQQVHIAGTGTAAFSKEYMPDSFYASPAAMEKFQGMADVWFACQANAHGLDITCIPRKSSWLSDVQSAGQTNSLYQKTKDDPKLVCQEINNHDWRLLRYD